MSKITKFSAWEKLVITDPNHTAPTMPHSGIPTIEIVSERDLLPSPTEADPNRIYYVNDEWDDDFGMFYVFAPTDPPKRYQCVFGSEQRDVFIKSIAESVANGLSECPADWLKTSSTTRLPSN